MYLSNFYSSTCVWMIVFVNIKIASIILIKIIDDLKKSCNVVTWVLRNKDISRHAVLHLRKLVNFRFLELALKTQLIPNNHTTPYCEINRNY